MKTITVVPTAECQTAELRRARLRLWDAVNRFRRKRQRAAALQDAGAFFGRASNRRRSWSAAALCRFSGLAFVSDILNRDRFRSRQPPLPDPLLQGRRGKSKT